MKRRSGVLWSWRGLRKRLIGRLSYWDFQKVSMCWQVTWACTRQGASGAEKRLATWCFESASDGRSHANSTWQSRNSISNFKFSDIFADRVAMCAKIPVVVFLFSLIFLTLQSAKAYQAVGVNFLPMSASSELEPGPRKARPIAGFAAQEAEGVREALHEMWLSVRAGAWGGFTAG